MKKFVLMSIVIAFVFLSVSIFATGKPDAISAASVQNYYVESSLTGPALFEALTKRTVAFSVATSNADGTPNAAVVIPGVVDENTLMFGLADNQTKVNLIERKLAVIVAYKYSPEEEDRLKRNIGARLVVEYIDDADEVARLMEKTGARPGTMFVRILEIMPLG